jgi:hypothetical protein
MIKKIIFSFVFLVNLVSAQTAGNSGVAFLKLGSGARNIAMSDLGVAGGNEVNAFNYNPSLLSVQNKTQLSFTHNNLFEDLSSEMFAGSFNAFGIPFAVNLNTTSISNIEIRTKPGDAISKFDANYFSAGISTAYRVFNDFHAGITVKYIYENLYSDEAAGFGLDFGFTFTGLADGLSIAAALRNIGSMNELRNESTKLPNDLRAGAAYSFNLGEAKLQINMLTGIQKYLDTDDLHFHLGAEVNYNDSFYLRGGFVSGYDSKNLSTGFGIKWKSLNIDYAYVPVKYGLGDSQILTFIFSFN